MDQLFVLVSALAQGEDLVIARCSTCHGALLMDRLAPSPRVARSRACFFISLLLVLLLGDFAICAADSTRQCAVPVGTKSFVFSSDGHTLRGFIEATAGGRNQPAILILHGSGSTDVMH